MWRRCCPRAVVDADFACHAKALTGTPRIRARWKHAVSFTNVAQIWREIQRPEDLRDRLTNDPHPPGRYRAMTVRNVDAWYAAFAVRPGRKMAMAPTDRVRIR